MTWNFKESVTLRAVIVADRREVRPAVR